MHGRILGGLVVAAVMTVVAWSGAAPALAQTGWSVTNPNADGTFTGTAPTLSLTNLGTGGTITCTSPVVDGSMPTAAGVERVGTLTLAEAADCTGPGGVSPVVGLFLDLGLYGVAYDAGAGRTTFEVVSFTDPLNVYRSDCNYYATGAYDFGYFPMTYTNATSQLAADRARFTVVYVEGAGCAGEVEVGDTLELSVSYTITPAIQITQ